MTRTHRRAPGVRIPGRVGCVACLLSTLLVPGTPYAGQLDTAVYIRLDRGMPESEVLLRAGPPDRVVEEPPSARYPLRTSGWRALHYVPAPGAHDPYLTVIHIRHGRVSRLERIKLHGIAADAMGSAHGSSPNARPPPVSDEALRRLRAERTVREALRYAEVRARIKARADAPAAGPGRADVYEGVDADGVRYYGDRPLPATEE